MPSPGQTAEGVVQVPPNSTGAKIRNLTVSALQADGSIASTDMQIVSLYDALTGLPVVLDDSDYKREVLRLLRLIADGLKPLGGTLGSG